MVWFVRSFVNTDMMRKWSKEKLAETKVKPGHKNGERIARQHGRRGIQACGSGADTHHAWRGKENADAYSDILGFCKSASLNDVCRHGHVLTLGRYVGAEPREDDGESFEAKMKRLVAELRTQQAEGVRLDVAIDGNLKRLGFEEEDMHDRQRVNHSTSTVPS